MLKIDFSSLSQLILFYLQTNLKRASRGSYEEEQKELPSCHSTTATFALGSQCSSEALPPVLVKAGHTGTN